MDPGPSRAEQFLATAAMLRERYETAPASELPLLAAVIAYIEALADLEGGASPAPGGTPGEPAAGAPPAPLLATVHETGWGGEAHLDGGGRERIPYSTMGAAGLHHGDRVELHPKGAGEHYRFVRTGETVPLDPPRIRERVADLRGEEGSWRVMIGDRLVRARRARQLRLRPGDVVSLRYDEAEMDGPDPVAWVTSVHDVPAGAPGPDAPAPRRRTYRLRRRPALLPPPPAAAVPLRLLIIGGHQRARLQYRAALRSLAAVDAVDGTRLTRSLKDRLGHAEAVVLVTQHMSHTVSEYVTAQIRASGIPSIWARSQNRSGLRRQVEEELLPLLRRGDGQRPAPGPHPGPRSAIMP